MNAIELVEKSQITTRPDMKSGDTIRVHVKVREGWRENPALLDEMGLGPRRD